MDNQKSFFKQHIWLWVVIGLLASSLIYLLYDRKQDEEKYGGTIDEIAIEKAILARDFQELALDYDSLHTNNDKMNELLSKERERVAQLIEEIQTLKSSNAAQIAQYKKELVSLRSVMRNFVVQIDSLNSRNQVLTAENKEVKKQMTQIKDSYQVLEKEREKLVQKVEIASKLETRNLIGEGLNKKGSETNRVGRISKIRVCFVILKNITAKVGEKNVYMRLARPDGALLIRSANDLFQFEGSSINYSAVRTIEYGGEDTDVCLFYDVDEGELLAGTYTADIFADGNHIGTIKFDLK
jgi:hypothetical protein